MPIAQRYGGTRVGANALPGARKSASETALSEGAGVAEAKGRTAGIIGQIGEGVAQTGIAQYGRVVAKARQDADETATLDASNQLDQFENTYLFGDGTDQNPGALARTGKEAQGLPEEALDAYNKRADEIEASLTTPEQKRAFAQLRARHQQNIDVTVRRHTFTESQKYKAAVADAALDNSYTAAVANANDWRRVGVELGKSEDVIRAEAERLGQPQEVVDARLEAQRTRIHLGVIDRMLANDDPAAAKKYFDQTRDQIAGDQVAKVEKALEEGGLRKQSQQTADTIIATNDTTQARLAEAKKIEDPKLRDMVEERIEHQDVIDQRLRRDAAESRDKTVYDFIEGPRTPSLAQLQLRPEWADMTVAQRDDATRHLERKIAGTPVPGGQPKYYELMGMAASLDAKERDAFLKMNLQDVRGKISQSDWDRVWSIQQSMRAGDNKKADADLDEFRTQNQVVNDALSLAGFDTNPNEKTPEGRRAQQELAQFYRIVDERVRAQQQLTGKKAGNKDVTQIADDVLRTFSQKPIDYSKWNVFGPNDVAASLFPITLADVPDADRMMIVDELRKRKMDVTEGTILGIYIANQARKKK